jgi:UDP-N-acetyl-2-amino-2-deoxyglucuronate dehydrogenase
MMNGKNEGSGGMNGAAERAGSTLRFALLGGGMIGQTHAQLIHSLPGRADLAAVIDADESRATAIAREFGADAMASLDQVCARSDIDAVSICLPSGAHASAAITAMRAGKHVVIEKPIEVTLEAADRIIKVEHETGTVISQRRFQIAPALVHRAVAAGRLGRVSSGIAISPFWRTQAYYESSPWRGTRDLDGGGALMNQGIHALDLLLWMLGEPVEVQAYTGLFAHERLEVEDTAAAIVRFASGALGSVVATTAAYPDLPVRLSVHGDNGSAVFDGDTLAYFHTRDAMRDGEAPGADQSAQLLPDSGSRSLDDALRDQYIDFIEAVALDRPPAITTQDGRRALPVVLAVYESARSGRPVRVD